MNDKDKMRAEFEAWSKAELTWPDQNFRLDAITGDSYFYTITNHTYRIWQAAYAAGRKADREAIVQTIRTVRGSLAWQSKISFAALAELIENKSENEQ